MGTYTSISAYEDVVKIANDYHSSAKLYYFSSAGKTYVSNRYHLLLKVLRMSGEKIDVDRDKAIAMLSTAYHSIFSHNFTSDCLMSGVRQLYIGENVEIDSRGARIVTSDAYRIISSDGISAYTEEAYAKGIKQASQEIVNNLKAIFDSGRYSDVIVDLSGGIDSRVVYCALTNLKVDRDIVSINIRKTKDESDHIVGNCINRLYGFPFYTAKNWRKYIPLDPKGVLSWVMEGKYFMAPSYDVSSPGSIVCNGFYGEPSLRPRGSAGILLGSCYENLVSSEEEFVNYFFPLHVSRVSIVDSVKHGFKLRKVYLAELKKTPGKQLSTKLENHYMNFSHAYHASESFRPGVGIDSVSPIKSETLFETYRNSLNVFKSRKVAFDLIYQLNPMLSAVPYESNKYNEAYRASIDTLMVSGNNMINQLSISTEVDLGGWERSLVELKSNTESSALSGNDDFFAAVNCLKWLRNISPEMFSEISIPIYHYLKCARDRYIQINTVRNKLEVICEHFILAGYVAQSNGS